MELSFSTLAMCADKYGKGTLYGFDGADVGTVSESNAKRAYDELVRSEMIDVSGDSVYINAFGQHILNMMIEPEIFIMLDNDFLGINVRVYVRNAYYLCAVEKKDGSAENLVMELLPNLKDVVSSFVYALYRESAEVASNAQESGSIRIVAKAWDEHRNPTSDMETYAEYCHENIRYHSVETLGDQAKETDESECEVSSLVNRLTKWMFDRISEVITGKEA